MKYAKKKLKFSSNKKAIGNDIDWIIAMGIFLIYLVMTLVYFKPGVKPVFNPDNLLDIVDENFGKTAYWEVTTQPMFVSRLNCINPVPPGSQTCPLYNNNNEMFEFFGNYEQATDNLSISLDNNALNRLLSLIQSNTQIFFVKPNTTNINLASDSIPGNRNTEETQAQFGATLPTEAQLKQQYEDKNCAKCECEINNLEKGRCEEHRNDQQTATCDRETDKNLISECRNLLEQKDKTKSNSGNSRGTEPTQENPVALNELIQTEFREGYIKFNVSNGNLRMKPYFSTVAGDKTKYLITTSSIKINDQADLTGSPSPSIPPNSYKGACLIANYNTNLKIGPNSGCFAKYELGVSETLKGIYLPGIANYADLSCEDNKKGYECVKLYWGYPSTKEFKIKVYTPDQKPVAEFPKEPIIPTNVNVYSRQYNSFILNDDGLKKPVIISILVW